MVDADVRGIAVHVGARIVELAAPDRSWSRHGSRPRRRLGYPFRRGPRRRAGRHAGEPGASSVLRHGASPEALRRWAVEQTNLFRRDGDYWTIGYRGLVVTLRDTRASATWGASLGPDREFHAST